MWAVTNAQNENWGLGHHNDSLERQKYHLKGLGKIPISTWKIKLFRIALYDGIGLGMSWLVDSNISP